MQTHLSPERSLSGIAFGAKALAWALLISGAGLLLWRGTADAYDSWSIDKTSGHCATCHGDFRAADYVSKNDGVAWNTSLHDGHRITMLSRDCDACHGANRFPVSLNSSAGGLGFPAISCAGCHGRAEPAAGGAVTGAGLRQHHWTAGEQGCGAVGCHTDANPANFQTAGEKVAPPYYFTPDTNHPDKPKDPCNGDGSESPVAPPLGLDNNGNNTYDASDPTCSNTGVGPGMGSPVLSLEGVWPNPSRARLRVMFVLADSRSATLELLDVSGRRLAFQEVGSLGPGRHALDLGAGATFPPGVYKVRLTQGERRQVTTAIVRR